MAKQKYYVVWEGYKTGVFSTWTECLLQINGYPNALYKSFPSKEEAIKAYNSAPSLYIQKKEPSQAVQKSQPTGERVLPKEVIESSLAVDAACSGNPGPMEYRGVYTCTGSELFHFGPIEGTNNIGEFLALVHGLAYCKQHKMDLPIYSDSVNAIKWVQQKKCKTKLKLTAKTAKVHQLIQRAEYWLHNNTYTTKIIKWDTKKWGEIPADFGRK